MSGHDIGDRARLRPAQRHAVGVAGQQRALFGGRVHVGGRGLGATVELGHVDVGAHRDRALVEVERDLEGLAHDQLGQERLAGAAVLAVHVEHGEAVDVVEIARAGGRGAEEVHPRGQTGGHELALGPVAHDLERGLAVHHHRCRQVPVTPGEVRIDEAAQDAHLVEDRPHRVRAQRLGVEIDERGLIELGSADAQDHGFEDRRVLPGLAAVGQRDDPLRLKRAGGGVELLPGGGHRHARALQDGGVGPDPVDAVDVDRGCAPGVLAHHVLGDGLGQDIGPALRLGDRRDVGQNALLVPFLDRRALELDRSGGIAGQHPGAQRGHGGVAAAARDRHVGPGAAAAGEFLLQHGDRPGLAARGPPMQHFGRLGEGCGRSRDHGGQADRQHGFPHGFLPLTALPAVALTFSGRGESGKGAGPRPSHKTDRPVTERYTVSALAMTIPRLLIVDDDDEMRAMLTRWLQAHGFAVAAARDGREARAAVEGRRIDLILLDVMLGDESGIEICRRLRAESEVPVIIVSALASDDHRMAGYRVGADDYVAKPFNPELLVERIRAVLRRGRRAASLAYRRRAARYLFAGCRFDAAGEDMVGADGVQIALSTRERRLLSVLLANPLIPLTREEIAQALDPDRDPAAALEAAEGRAIDVLVARLRAKLEPDPRSPRITRTERGTGYVLGVPVTVEEG